MHLPTELWVEVFQYLAHFNEEISDYKILCKSMNHALKYMVYFSGELNELNQKIIDSHCNYKELLNLYDNKYIANGLLYHVMDCQYYGEDGEYGLTPIVDYFTDEKKTVNKVIYSFGSRLDTKISLDVSSVVNENTKHYYSLINDYNTKQQFLDDCKKPFDQIIVVDSDVTVINELIRHLIKERFIRKIIDKPPTRNRRRAMKKPKKERSEYAIVQLQFRSDGVDHDGEYKIIEHNKIYVVPITNGVIDKYSEYHII
jgi:hypothetical protein